MRKTQHRNAKIPSAHFSSLNLYKDHHRTKDRNGDVNFNIQQIFYYKGLDQ